MTNIYHVSLMGPQDGKPQKGTDVWLHFVHADKERAKQLGETAARVLRERTGHDVTVEVAQIPLIGGDEASVLREIDDIAARYGDVVSCRSAIVEATMLKLNEASWSRDASSLAAEGLGRSLIEDLANDHGIRLKDWIVLAEEFPHHDMGSEWRTARVLLSMPEDQANILLNDVGAVAAYLLRLGTAESCGASTGGCSLHDDDARMEEIAADAEDAALNAWGSLGSPVARENPHPDGSDEAEYWNTVFMASYARENGK